MLRLVVLYNKLLRILQNKPYICNVKELYCAYNTWCIPDLHVCHLLSNVHKLCIMVMSYLCLVFEDAMVEAKAKAKAEARDLRGQGHKILSSRCPRGRGQSSRTPSMAVTAYKESN